MKKPRPLLLFMSLQLRALRNDYGNCYGCYGLTERDWKKIVVGFEYLFKSPRKDAIDMIQLFGFVNVDV
jgi:hypothetical protein